jgi:hypothetical protein
MHFTQKLDKISARTNPRGTYSLLLAASLKTIAELQNEIVNYFHNTVEHVINTEIKRKQIPL